MSLTLYYHPLSSYCHKALVGLYELGTPFEPRLIDLSQPDDRDALAAVWPLVKFPVLHDNARGQNVAEASVILEYLDLYYPGAEALLPANRADALAVRLWDRVFDLHVQTPMQQIVADRLKGQPFVRQGQAQPALQAIERAWGLINGQLQHGAPWVCGPQFSMADCAAAPALFFAHTLQPIDERHPLLLAYFDRLMARASVERVLREAQPYLQFYPFHELIAPRFLDAPPSSPVPL